jgi:RHS repeat-associated protein
MSGSVFSIASVSNLNILTSLKTMKSTARCIAGFICCAQLVVSGAVPLDPWLAQLPVVERIMSAPVFETPLVFVGNQPPDLVEAATLWVTIDVMRQQGPGVGVPLLEEFIQAYTNSVWNPSLRNNLGFYYRNLGRYSLALDHWLASWEATKTLQDSNGRAVADFALAHLTRLLASLGRKEMLNVIFQETRGWTLDGGALQQMYLVTREAYATMVSAPGIAYRCGSIALANVARVEQPNNPNIAGILSLPSPETGFSLTALKNIADQNQLNLVAVRRAQGDAIIVPAVIHWKLGHYAAITAQEGNRYKVEDPTFEHTIWMTAETINAEASGYFMIPFGKQAAGWNSLSPTEGDQVFGRGFPYLFRTEDCEDCPTEEEDDEDSDPQNPLTSVDPGDPSDECPSCNGSGGPGSSSGGSGSSSGGPSSGCVGCGKAGLPTWKVAEPYINLWIVDRPTIYTKSTGKRQSFKVMYKQRNSRSNSLGFGFGPSWESSRMTYFYQDSSGAFTHYVPGGGTRIYALAGGLEYKIAALMSLSINQGGQTNAVIVSFKNGATHTFNYTYTYYVGTRHFYLGQHTDRYGRSQLYNYANVGANVHLTSVQDYDGRYTTFAYNNGSYPHSITDVTNAHGHVVRLKYDSNGRLTNIVDAIGISSSFVYDSSSGWITNLVTPHGSTGFRLTGSGENLSGQGQYSVHRSCTVTHPNGSKELFIYRRNAGLLNDNLDAPSLIALPWPAAEIPTLPYENSLDTRLIDMHDSFYWNPKQYSGITADFRSDNTNFNLLNVSDYDLARMKHWLISYDGWILAGTLAMQRDGSADGTSRGQTTWYDYAGKLGNHREGTNSAPQTIARVLPNGQTNYIYYERNYYRKPTVIKESYGDGSTERVWHRYYTNNIDLWYETGPNNEMVRGFSYNGIHQVLTATNAATNVTIYVYDGQNRLSQRILPTGLTNNYSYGGDGFVSQVTDQPINRTGSYTYLNSFVRTHTDARGMTRTFTYDGLHRPTQIDYPDTTYESFGYTIMDLKSKRDRMGNWTYFGYDALRRLVVETNASGTITGYAYCDCGSLDYVTNAFGIGGLQAVTQFLSDFQGNVTNIVYADGTSVSDRYDSLRRLTNRLDALSSTTYWYNNQGLLTAVSNAIGQVSKAVYDIEDRGQYVTDANGVTITNTYDNAGRLLTRGYPDGGVEKFGYSARGLVNYTNQIGKIIRYVYDEASRKLYETNANSEVLQFTYNAAGDLLTLKDGKNQQTTWSYDVYGRVTNKLDQASVEILRYQYDADNRLTNRWSKAKGNTKYTYDSVGNVTFVDYPASTDITFRYDALSRLTNMIDAVGTSYFTYTSAGNLLTEDNPWSTTDTVTYGYHASVPGLRTSLSLQQPTSTWTNGYAYDAARRLTNVTSQAGSFGYKYQGATLLVTNLALPNTAKIWTYYDNMGRVFDNYLDTSGGSTLNYHGYDYDLAGRRLDYLRYDNSYVDYSYDDIGQLKSAKSYTYSPFAEITSERRGYLYDAAWNLNTRTNSGGTTAFNVDVKNQLTSVGGSSCTYDTNGNLTLTPNSVTCAYDDENQLTSAETASNWRTEWVYDGRGRLRVRKEYIWSSGWILNGETRYIYDGKRVIQERNSSNNPLVAYTRGNDLSGSFEGAGGIGGLLGRSHGYSSGNWGTHNFYHADGNGNVTYLVNSSQTLACSYRYDPFGNLISSANGSLNAADNVYRFSSKEIKIKSGMYYYGYRFYDPNLQRWLNRDPIGELGFGGPANAGSRGITDELNLYWFARNNSPNKFDAFGLEDQTIQNAGARCCGGSPANARSAVNQGMAAADAAYPTNDQNDHRHEAMRHCVASAMLAISEGSKGCFVAACIGSSREALQTFFAYQPGRSGRRGINNNFLGRQCAGCEGSDASRNPKEFRVRGGWIVPGRPLATSLEDAIKCCRNAIDNGKADTGP